MGCVNRIQHACINNSTNVMYTYMSALRSPAADHMLIITVPPVLVLVGSASVSAGNNQSVHQAYKQFSLAITACAWAYLKSTAVHNASTKRTVTATEQHTMHVRDNLDKTYQWCCCYWSHC
jgi:hypothetical protein